jgi:hypothetical protein
MPKDAKPFKSVGSGVLEIALRLRVGRLSCCAGGTNRQTDLHFARLPEEIDERH